MLAGEKWLQFEFAALVELDLIRQWLAPSVSGLNDRYTPVSGHQADTMSRGR